MAAGILAALRRVSDLELVRRLKGLAARERETTAHLIAHIVELERRDLHLRAGYGSLFVYCRDELRLSEAEAYHRIEAARAARRYPLILEMLREGSLNLTTIRLLGRYLTAENHRDVLASARRKTKAQVEEIAAALWPRPDVPPSIRRLPATRTAGGPDPARTPSPVPAGAGAVAPPPVAAPPTSAPPAPPSVSSPPGRPPVPAVAALAPERYKVQFTIGAQTLEKLRLAKDMLRHAIPSGDEATILDRALTVLLAELAKKKFADTVQPRPGQKATPGSRHVPAEVRRAVWRRDVGRCAFTAADGRRCAERGLLEFHHVEPYAIGGEATVANVQLRCRRHNGYEARLAFGDDRVWPTRSDSSRSEFAKAAGGSDSSQSQSARERPP